MKATLRALCWCLLFSLAWLTEAKVALAQCPATAQTGAGVPVDIVRVEGKKVTSDGTLAYGTVEVVTSGTANILRYTPRPGTANSVEKVNCQIEGEPKKVVEVTIKPVPMPGAETVYGGVAKTLVLLFALAVLLESALAGVFRWRPFAETLNPRAVRPLVAFLAAWWFVYSFDIDMVTALVNASTADPPRPVNTAGQILTALVLAGGSAGVNAMLVALGFRQVTTPETQPKPRANKAWISVRARRGPATTGSIDALIGPMATLSNGEKEPPYAGTINGRSGTGFLAFFARDRGRYPGYGGHEVDPNQEIYVVLQGNPNTKPPQLATWGPHKLAEGAIVDLELDV